MKKRDTRTAKILSSKLGSLIFPSTPQDNPQDFRVFLYFLSLSFASSRLYPKSVFFFSLFLLGFQALYTVSLLFFCYSRAISCCSEKAQFRPVLPCCSGKNLPCNAEALPSLLIESSQLHFSSQFLPAFNLHNIRHKNTTKSLKN